jgi:hypothetical protein
MNKKPRKKSTAKRRAASPGGSVAKLRRRIAAQARELREAAEENEATREVLRMIATASGNLQAVLDTVAERAARLCDANDAQILRVDGDVLRRVASFGSHRTAETRPITRDIAAGRRAKDFRVVRHLG